MPGLGSSGLGTSAVSGLMGKAGVWGVFSGVGSYGLLDVLPGEAHSSGQAGFFRNLAAAFLGFFRSLFTHPGSS